MRIHLVCLLLVACGGAESNTPPPATPAVASPPPEAPKAESPKTGENVTAAITGHWCGKDVPDAAKCTGDDVMYLDLKGTGDVVTGEICEAYGKDCTPLKVGSFKGNALALEFAFKRGSAGTGSFVLESDGVLSGGFRAARGKAVVETSMKLFRVK